MPSARGQGRLGLWVALNALPAREVFEDFFLWLRRNVVFVDVVKDNNL